jgi:Cu-processing system ATP-binding protein
MISINNVNKTFRRLQALANVNLDLSMGKAYALIGPNGSGKTTLIKSVLGMVIPTSGEILFDGKSIAREWKYRENIGYMPQIGRYPENMTIGQVVDMMNNIRGKVSRIGDGLIDAFKLFKLYDKRMHTLSGGTRQKVSAALAFMFDPDVLILDEPTAGLDPVSVEVLKEKILEEKAKGKLLIISSHILSDLDDLTTDIVYLYEGEVHYNNSIRALKDETEEKRLGKAIATMIRQKQLMGSITGSDE